MEIQTDNDWHIEVIGNDGKTLNYADVCLDGYGEAEIWLGDFFNRSYSIQ
jgi:hypothetical protein